MELGGNAPLIVFEDADIDKAVAGAMLAKMRNLGEACTAANRFYVHEKVGKEFTRKFSAAMAALKMGDGLEDGIDVGPLVNADTRDKVAHLSRMQSPRARSWSSAAHCRTARAISIRRRCFPTCRKRPTA
jgi:acyl-CoA reductase-like NAD-dependent aldehyde dehydrogenase